MNDHNMLHLPPDLKEEIRKEFFNAKPWNHHFFGKIMESDLEVCQSYTTLIFQELQKIYGKDKITIPHIVYCEAEKTIPPADDPDDPNPRKTMRPDVCEHEESGAKILHDLHNSLKNAYDGRWRMYREGADHWNMLEKEPWSVADAKMSTMIVTVTFDFCKNGRHINVVERRSRWKSERLPDIQIETVYLSSKGTCNDISDELREFLEYLETGIIQNKNKLAMRYQKDMEKLKKDRGWEERYMTMSYEERMRIGSYEEGVDQGIDKTRATIAKNMLAGNMPEEKIHEFTGLPIPEIRKLMK